MSMYNITAVHRETGVTRQPTEEEFLAAGYINVDRVLDEFARLKAMKTKDRPGFMAWFKAFLVNIESAMQEVSK